MSTRSPKGPPAPGAIEARVARGDLIGFAEPAPPAHDLLAAGLGAVGGVVLEDLVVVILEGLEAALGDAEGAEVGDRAVPARGEGGVEEADPGDCRRVDPFRWPVGPGVDDLDLGVDQFGDPRGAPEPAIHPPEAGGVAAVHLDLPVDRLLRVHPDEPVVAFGDAGVLEGVEVQADPAIGLPLIHLDGNLLPVSAFGRGELSERIEVASKGWRSRRTGTSCSPGSCCRWRLP